MEYVENEYYVSLKYGFFEFEFISDSPYLSDNGMIARLPDEATEVTYKVRMYSTKDQIDVTKEYTVTLPAKSVIKNYK